MRLGISSYTYTWAIGVKGNLPDNPLNAIGLIDKASALGVKCVQIADNLPLHSLSSEELDALYNYSERLGVAIEVGKRGLTPENLSTYLALATKFKSPILRVVVDGTGYHPHEDDCVAIIKDFLPELKERNIILAIENHDRFTARTFRSIVERINSDRVGICLDSVNSIGAGEGIETVVEILGPLTVNLHIKDYTARRVYHMMGFTIEGTPAGQGMLPIEWMLEKLSIYNRCQSGILELWTPPEDHISKTVAKEDKWAVESIAYLRKLISA
jgi:3-oxoisoapionate decarboxylase